MSLLLKNRFDAKKFGGRIRDWRKKKGITQEQLSRMLNVSTNHLAKVETGGRYCSIELLQEISDCLNVGTDDLLNGNVPPVAVCGASAALRQLWQWLRHAGGGDSDTLACITGGIAEAFYGMSSELQQETLKRLPEEMRAAYELFRQNLERRM